MAEDQAAGRPPAAETAILALGAGAAGPEPAAAPGVGGDLAEVSDTELGAVFRELDILAVSPPCGDWSLAGRQRRRAGCRGSAGRSMWRAQEGTVGRCGT